ncbi:E3 ubiquitin-protein ligase RNF146-like isoform X2 [Dinothrombium tinctorium]|uniref:E3 ubiquitin-protein ligase n=1 Tax=Dinothrombium tinctorium TaxID=1965070 RepID=A0A3S3S565_9ACAR|nr:E3 ubiquitin-protein ligase RNF146-like isoform X2 [Dinothrombium tinctorium]RWS10553.1 E3 ubiquitin-protein ligase RNF146-like isoform X2 [Dinothrombium tinctorium]RWS13234.1 E3 ubiquitin-protein ligase RNF146-like isoform X2 [Dinothrombium tinctorium]RWS16698.1 E3 ubiquitin-protein ligase RNF146-like isoform X2 [Dinothrombium tinctorium]
MESELCSICLQKFVNPVRLPCDHTFCFLCVKGAANVNKRCAICRQEIADSYFDNPTLVDETAIEAPVFDDQFQWFYEGRNGWWLYDKRTGEELETAFKSGEKRCELLIAGYVYVIDFDAMLQYRRNEPHRKRRVKRDLPDSASTKGVAGIRILNTMDVDASGDQQKATPSAPSPSDLSPQSAEENEESERKNETAENAATRATDEQLSSLLTNALNLRRTYHETYL